MGQAGEDIGDAVALYNPNGPAAIIFFLVFGSVAGGLWYRHFKNSPRAKYMRPVRYGATFMALGYICRFSRRNGINAWSWLFETLFILLSPCALLAQIYLLLPRLVHHLGADDCLPIGPRTIKWIFLLADVTTVVTQLAGTALTITFGDLVKIGKWLVTGGLAVQLIFFSAFCAIFVTTTLRLHRQREHAGKWNSQTPQRRVDIATVPWNQRWTTLLVVLHCACLCMFVRSIYRVAEYISGGNSSLANSEVAFYVLDAVMMLVIVFSFLLVWPPGCLGPDREEQRGVEMTGP